MDAEAGVAGVGSCEGDEGVGSVVNVFVVVFKGEDAAGVDIEAVGGGLEGVLVVEDGCVVVAKDRLSLISPYSFHSSTSARSCPTSVHTLIHATQSPHYRLAFGPPASVQ